MSDSDNSARVIGTLGLGLAIFSIAVDWAGVAASKDQANVAKQTAELAKQQAVTAQEAANTANGQLATMKEQLESYRDVERSALPVFENEAVIGYPEGKLQRNASEIRLPRLRNMGNGPAFNVRLQWNFSTFSLWPPGLVDTPQMAAGGICVIPFLPFDPAEDVGFGEQTHAGRVLISFDDFSGKEHTITQMFAATPQPDGAVLVRFGEVQLPVDRDWMSEAMESHSSETGSQSAGSQLPAPPAKSAPE